MQLPEQFTAYINQICNQLRWKKARAVIQREMEAHLCDQYDSLVKSGMPEKAAVEETLRRTGDAVEIGAGLDRVHRPKPSWDLLILTGILLLTGLAIKLFFTYDSDFPHELPPCLWPRCWVSAACLVRTLWISRCLADDRFCFTFVPLR